MTDPYARIDAVLAEDAKTGPWTRVEVKTGDFTDEALEAVYLSVALFPAALDVVKAAEALWEVLRTDETLPGGHVTYDLGRALAAFHRIEEEQA